MVWARTQRTTPAQSYNPKRKWQGPKPEPKKTMPDYVYMDNPEAREWFEREKDLESRPKVMSKPLLPTVYMPPPGSASFYQTPLLGPQASAAGYSGGYSGYGGGSGYYPRRYYGGGGGGGSYTPPARIVPMYGDNQGGYVGRAGQQAPVYNRMGSAPLRRNWLQTLTRFRLG